MELFDSHAHYDDDKFNEDREDVIYATAGISPNDIPGEELEEEKLELKTEEEKKILFEQSFQIFSEYLKEIEELAKNKKVVAIGEIGLDYHWNKQNKELQKKVFIAQIELANKLNLPIVIHTREAVMDTLDILKNIQRPIKPGVFHCCPLNIELVKEAIKIGFYISFAGPVTFKSSKNAKEVAQLVPIDRILLETDSPYLAPEPVRGTRNDSRNIKYIAQKIAEFKNVSMESLAKEAYENTKRVFNI